MRLAPLVSAIALTLALGGGSQAAGVESIARIAYVADGQVRVMNGDSSRSRALAEGTSPTWSPSGSVIAFETSRIPANGRDIYLMRADGTDERRLVTHPGGGGDHPINNADDYEPAWSPAGSGRTIAFTTNRDGNNEIYTMDEIGHSTQRVTNHPASDRQPAWSPDGESIAFVSNRDGNDEIYAVDSHQVVTRLTRAAEADRAPAWSPDGRRIAFQSLRDGNWELYVMDADGANPRRLTQSPEEEANPSWSPDGTTIAFTIRGVGGATLGAISPAGGPVRRLSPAGQAADLAEWQSVDDMSLTVRRSATVRRGNRIELRLTVRNKTSVPTYNVVITAAIPRGTRLAGARAGSSSGSCVDGGDRTVECWVPRVGRSATVRARIALRPRRCGRMVVRASVRSGQADLTQRDNRRAVTLRVRCPS